jgi:prepilin-type processing-associated H-X9-DG protein
MWSERRIGDYGSYFRGERDIVGLPLLQLFLMEDLSRDFFTNLAVHLAESPPTSFFPESGHKWHFAGKKFVLYDHVFPPGGSVSGIIKGSNHVSSVTYIGAVGASSYHRGYVNVARLDGSVGSSHVEIDLKVWRELGSIR